LGCVPRDPKSMQHGGALGQSCRSLLLSRSSKPWRVKTEPGLSWNSGASGINEVKFTSQPSLASDPAVVTASEANRTFSSLLRQVAKGQSFTLHSHGRPVAQLTPVDKGSRTNPAARQALLARLAAQPASGETRAGQRDDLYD